MSGKRKFSASFERDLDITQSLLKYRKTSTPVALSKLPAPSVSQEELRSMVDKFVCIYEQLDSKNNAKLKPNYTYTEMIFLAVMRSPNFCLPITEIYRYIETRFLFFRQTTNQQWKNAVRHSLSKTKCFQKIGLKDQKPRNGILNRSAFLWTILPRSLLSFARGDYRPTNKFSGSNSLRSAFNQVNAGGLWQACVITLSERIDAFQNILDQSKSPAKLFQLQVCNLDCNNCDIGPAENGSVTLHLQSGKKMFKNDFTCTDRISQSSEPLDSYNSVLSPRSEIESSSTSIDSGYDSFGTPERFNSSGSVCFSVFSSSARENIESSSWQWLSAYLNPHHRSDFLTDDIELGGVPEVKPECIFNVPMIPFLPPLKLSFDDVVTDTGNVSHDAIAPIDENNFLLGQEVYMNFPVLDNSVLQELLYV